MIYLKLKCRECGKTYTREVVAEKENDILTAINAQQVQKNPELIYLHRCFGEGFYFPAGASDFVSFTDQEIED